MQTVLLARTAYKGHSVHGSLAGVRSIWEMPKESCCFNLLCHASAKLFCPTLRKFIIVNWVLNTNKQF